MIENIEYMITGAKMSKILIWFIILCPACLLAKVPTYFEKNLKCIDSGLQAMCGSYVNVFRCVKPEASDITEPTPFKVSKNVTTPKNFKSLDLEMV